METRTVWQAEVSWFSDMCFCFPSLPLFHPRGSQDGLPRLATLTSLFQLAAYIAWTGIWVLVGLLVETVVLLSVYSDSSSIIHGLSR